MQRRGGAAPLASRSCASSAPRRAQRASRRRAASRASCTTSSARRSRRSRWTWRGCKARLAAGAPDAAAKLDRDGGPARRHRRGHAPHLLRPAAAHARRPRPRARRSNGWCRTSRSAPASLASLSIDDPAISTCRTRTRRRSSASCRSRSPTSRSTRARSHVEVTLDARRRRQSLRHGARQRHAASRPTTRASRTRSACSGCASASTSSSGNIVDRQRARHGRRPSWCAFPCRKGSRRMIRIVIADDHTIVREGLSQLLGAAGDIDGRRRGGERRTRCSRACAALEFDVLLLDMSMPGKSGIELIKQVHAREAEAAHPRALDARGARSTRCAPSRPAPPATSPRTAPRASWSTAIRKVAGGRRLHQRRGRRAARAGRDARRAGPRTRALSDREFQVFRCWSTGRRVTDIAARLNLSVKTVSTHKAHIMQKMNMSNQAELIRYAINNRLVDSGEVG